MITFDLPDHHNRQEIAAQYAKHLSKAELVELASATDEYVIQFIAYICNSYIISY